jgi:hypothetical protein
MTNTPTRFDLNRHGDDEQDGEPAALDYDSYVTAAGQLDRTRLVRDLAATLPAAEAEPAEADDTDYRTADRTVVDAEIRRIRNR